MQKAGVHRVIATGVTHTEVLDHGKGGGVKGFLERRGSQSEVEKWK